METITTTASVEAALAGAAIHILNITPIQADGTTTNLVVTFEFQYKSRGNYVWGNSVHIDYAVDEPGSLVVPIIDKVVQAREILEDPKDPGRYNYLHLEA